jgi:hypothetical protein
VGKSICFLSTIDKERSISEIADLWNFKNKKLFYRFDFDETMIKAKLWTPFKVDKKRLNIWRILAVILIM